MNEYNYDEKKLKEYLSSNDLKSAKDYIKLTENYSDDEAIKFLHKYINENNINIKKPTDINTGLKNVVLIILGIILVIAVLLILSFGVIKSIIDDGSTPSKILFLVVLTISLIACIAYAIILILDLVTKKTIITTGYYNIFTLNSSRYKNNVIKFESGEALILPYKINEALKNFNYCTITRFKYSKLIKSVTNIK